MKPSVWYHEGLGLWSVEERVCWTVQAIIAADPWCPAWSEVGSFWVFVYIKWAPQQLKQTDVENLEAKSTPWSVFHQIIPSFCSNASTSPERPLTFMWSEKIHLFYTALEFKFFFVKHAETFWWFIFLSAATFSTLNKTHKLNGQSNMVCFL